MKKTSKGNSLKYRILEDRIKSATAANCPIEAKWYFFGEMNALDMANVITPEEFEKLRIMLNLDTKSYPDIVDFIFLGRLSDDIKEEEEDF